MKRYLKNTLMGLMASSMLSLTACTDLTENLYSTLNDTNIDFDSEKYQ